MHRPVSRRFASFRKSPSAPQSKNQIPFQQHQQHRLHLSPKDAAKSFRLARQALINSVDGFAARTMLRIRLFLMGQVRPMKMDDAVALFSWIFVGNTLFILARTTAFVSVLVVIVNSLQFQEYIAQKLSDYLTKSTGFNVTFESAIVPRWREGTLSLENVKIVCNGDTWTQLKHEERQAAGLSDIEKDDEDINVNWTYWDLTVDRIDITLSLWRLLDGRGVVKDARLKGVRGVVDRRHIIPDPNWVPTRRDHGFGDFEMDHFVIDDLLVTVHNGNFRPFSISIFSADLPLFRKQWLLYDIMCADSVVGMFDNCLFSVHRPQNLDVFRDKPGNWAKVSHLKINSVPIDHLNAGATGPLTWITRGTADIDMYLLIPQALHDDAVFDRILEELDGIREVALDKIEEAISSSAERRLLGIRSLQTSSANNDVSADAYKPTEHGSAKTARLRLTNLKSARHYGTQHPVSQNSAVEADHATTRDSPTTVSPCTDVVMHWRVRLNDLKASVPIINPHLSYMSNAFIRPVVAYMNANRTSIPLSFSTKMDVNNFNGAWDIYAAGLVDVLSEETGRALTALVQNDRERSRRLRRVGIWGLQELGKHVVVLAEYIRGIRSPLSPATALVSMSSTSPFFG